MNHLGTQISALADGQLSPTATERALSHVAVCRACAEELQAAREARRTLAGAGDVLPAPDLTARLLAMATPPDQTPHLRDAWTGSSVPLPGQAARVAHGSLRGDVVGRPLVPRALVAAVTGGVGVVALGLVVVGGQPAVVPETDRSYALTLLAEAGPADRAAQAGARAPVAAAVARTTPVPDAGPLAPLTPTDVAGLDLEGEAAHAEVLSWMADRGWACPVGLPDGFRVTGLRLAEDGRSLELDLAHAGGTVVVLQEPGRLDEDAVGALPVHRVHDRDVHLVSADPWYVVWQDGDTVVTVVAEGSSDAARELVGAHPGAAYDDGLTARLARGWQSVAGSWSP